MKIELLNAKDNFYAFIKPELREGTGGWMAIGWRDGLSFFETFAKLDSQRTMNPESPTNS